MSKYRNIYLYNFMVKVRKNAVVFAMAALLAAAPSWAAGYLYRYFDDAGRVVIGNAAPPEFVRHGYKELNPDGSVNRVVKPTLTAEQLANRSQEDIDQEIAEKNAKRLREYDESLMLRYSSVEDVEAARDRALGELQIRVSILRSNVRSIKTQVENNQARAADIERSGGTVPLEIVSAIDDLLGEIEETDRVIIERGREMDVVQTNYQRDIDRFALLLDKVRLRNRRYYSSD